MQKNIECTYDGSTISNTIYKLQTDNILIKDDSFLLIEAIGKPEVEIDPLELRTQVYLLRGSVKIYDDAVYMFTLAGGKLFDLERSYRTTCSQK